MDLGDVDSAFPFECDSDFIAIGHKPNTDLFKGQLELDHAGYLKTVERTNGADYRWRLGGNVQDSIDRQAITAAGTGSRAVIADECGGGE